MNAFLLLLTASFVGIAYAGYFDVEFGLTQKKYHRGTVEKTHLVTMRRAELMNIINCVSDAIAAKDVKTCERFSRCESMMAPKVIRAYKSCRRAIAGVSWTRCIPGRPLFTDSKGPERVFDCIEDKVEVETPEERFDMVKFEQCSRKVRDQGCKYRSSRRKYPKNLGDYLDIYDEFYKN